GGDAEGDVLHEHAGANANLEVVHGEHSEVRFFLGGFSAEGPASQYRRRTCTSAISRQLVTPRAARASPTSSACLSVMTSSGAADRMPRRTPRARCASRTRSTKPATTGTMARVNEIVSATESGSM